MIRSENMEKQWDPSIGRWIELWLKILILSCNHREMWEPRCEHKSFQAFIIRKLRKSLSGNFCFNFKIEDKATCWKIQTVRLTPNGEISWLMKFRTPRQGLGTNLRLMRASLVPQMVMNLQQCRRPSWIPGLGKSPGEGNGNPLHYSCLENSMDRGAWRATQSMGTQNRAQLND